MGLTKSPKVSTKKISPVEILAAMDYQCSEMSTFPQSHIQISDWPYLGLFFHSNRLDPYKHVIEGQNAAKITNKPKRNKVHIHHILNSSISLRASHNGCDSKNAGLLVLYCERYQAWEDSTLVLCI